MEQINTFVRRFTIAFMPYFHGIINLIKLISKMQNEAEG